MIPRLLLIAIMTGGGGCGPGSVFHQPATGVFHPKSHTQLEVYLDNEAAMAMCLATAGTLVICIHDDPRLTPSQWSAHVVATPVPREAEP